MKVAEIYGELMLKLSGSSKTDLDEFQKRLEGIADAAKTAALALKQIAQTPLPAAARRTQPAPAAPASATPVAPPAGTPGATPAAPSANPSQNQTAKALMFGLKVLGIASLAVAIKRLVTTMTQWVGASMKSTVNMDLFNRRTGIAAKTMQEWELASQKAGLAEGEATAAMDNLSRRWQNMQKTGEGAPAFQMLGLDPSAGPEKIFQRFRERTKLMSQAEAVWYGTMLGFSEDFSAFLHNMQGDIRRLGSDAISREDVKNVTELNAAWVELTSSLGRLRDKIVADLAPTLVDWIRSIDQAVTAITRNREKVYSFMDKLGDVLENMSDSGFARIKTDRRPYFGPPLVSPPGGTTVNNDVKINVDGSKDPAATAEAVRRALERSNANAYYQRYQLLGGPPPAPANP